MNTENRKKNITVILVVCAVSFVLLFALSSIDSVIGVISSVVSVLSPVIIGFAIAYMLNPILRLFEFKIYKKIKNRGLLRGLSLVSTYIVAVLIIVAFLWLLIPSLITSVVELVSKYDTYIEGTSTIINNFLNKLFENESFAEYVNPESVQSFITNIFTVSEDLLDTVIHYVVEYGTGLFTGVKNVVLGIFISIYVLISKEKLQAQIRKIGTAMLPDKRNRRIERYVFLTHRTFSGFFVGKIIDSAIILLITLVLMLIFRLEYPLLISVIVGVTNIIPIFGPIIGAIPSFFILFIVEPRQAIIFLILIILIQQLDGNVIGPKILGDSTGISSLGVIVAIVVMGAYFGVLGMLIGVPIFAVATTILKEYFETKLRKKGKSTDTADYYLKDSIVDPYETHESVSKRMFNNTKKSVLKIAGLFSGNKKKDVGEVTEATEEKAQVEENSNSEGENKENDGE